LRIVTFLKSIWRVSYDFHSRRAPTGKLGASLNIFDGEELLLDLVSSIRKEVDFISIIFQENGHWGDLKADPHLRHFLQELKELSLIDEFVEWSPPRSATNEYSFHEMDVAKRELGLQLARENNCTHFIVLDNDEFYSERQLRYMKRIMMQTRAKWDYSVLRHLQYYKQTNLIKKKREEEYVMGIFKINESTKFAHGIDSKFAIDPARKIQGTKILEFSRFEVCMHHLSYLRKNVRTKLLASQARFGNLDSLEEIVAHYESYSFPQKGLWAHGVQIELKRIKPVIKLKYYERDSYSKYSLGVPLISLISSTDLPSNN
jgi:hypothetical protein